MFRRDTHMTFGDWFVFHLLMAIPLVNVIIYIMLLFSSNTNRSLKSYILLPLIIGLIILAVIMFLIFVGVGLPNIDDIISI